MNDNPTTRAAPAAQGSASFLDARTARPNPDGSVNILRFGDGLDLWVGRHVKTWRCKVQRDGKRTQVTLGYFPAMTINQARGARMAILNAKDPIREKRVAKAAAATAATTLGEVATRWIEARSAKAHWTKEVHAAIEARVARYILPTLGERAIGDVTMEDVAALIGAIHKNRPGHKGRPRTAVFVKQHLSAICDYALRWRMVPFNPVRQIGEDLPSRSRGDEQARAHVSTIENARAVLAAVEARRRELSPWTLLAHRLIALTGVRKAEALGARWSEFDLEAALWTVPAERVKGRYDQRREHLVALAPQAIDVIRAAYRIRANEFVFAAVSPRHAGKLRLNRSTLNAVLVESLDRAGLGRVMVPHGWRATFATIMNETDASDFRVIDVMIGHSAFRDSVEHRDGRRSSVESRYNHAQHRSARHRIACQWADMLLDGAPSAFALVGLDEAAAATNVIPLRRIA